MCQSITEVASKAKFQILASDFHVLNRCLDVAIAGAVTTYQALEDAKIEGFEGKNSQGHSKEMRNALTSANVALQAIKKDTVGFNGNTGQVLENSLKRLGELIESPPIQKKPY